MAKIDKRTKEARRLKWIKEQRAFGRRFKISKAQTESTIKMRLAGYENIAGLDKRGIKSFGYKNTSKMKIKKKRNKNFYIIWRKKK